MHTSMLLRIFQVKQVSMSLVRVGTHFGKTDKHPTDENSSIVMRNLFKFINLIIYLIETWGSLRKGH